MSYLFLTLAIAAEVVGSSLLKMTNGFRRILPTIICLAAYFLAYFSVAQSLRTMPLNVAYATWCGAGTVLTMCCGAALYKEHLTPKNIPGAAILLTGIIMLNCCQ